MKNTAIVYFSESNNTKCAAEYVAEKTGATLLRLEGESANNPMKGMLHGSTRPKNDPWAMIDQFDRLILMSPIYAFNGVPVIRGFLKEADLKGKEVFLLTNGAGPAGKISEKVARQYEKLIDNAHGKLVDSVHTVGGNMNQFAGEEHHHQQIDAVINQVSSWLAK